MTVRPERPTSLGRGLSALIPQRGAGQPGPIEIPVAIIVGLAALIYIVRHVRKVWAQPEPSGPEV